MLMHLLSLVALAAAASSNTATGSGSSLRDNNPLRLPFVLCTALWSTLVGAQVAPPTNVNQQLFVADEQDDIEGTIITGVALDDDDNDFLSDLADEFADAPTWPIQFFPLTYPIIFAAIPAWFVIGMWASYDIAGTALTMQRVRALSARVRANGSWWYYPLIIAGTAALRAMIWLVQVGFVIIGLIYLLQSMFQWTVIENNNGTQSVIAEEGLFLVTQPTAATFATIAAVPTAVVNFPPFLLPVGTVTGAFQEIVISPTSILIRNTWWLYIVSVLLIAIVMFNFAAALMWRASAFIFAAVMSFLAFAAFVLLIIFTAFELSDLNPGQQQGEEIAMVIYAAVATLLVLIVMDAYIAFAVLFASEENQDILAMNDDELDQVVQSTKKRT